MVWFWVNLSINSLRLKTSHLDSVHALYLLICVGDLGQPIFLAPQFIFFYSRIRFEFKSFCSLLQVVWLTIANNIKRVLSFPSFLNSPVVQIKSCSLNQIFLFLMLRFGYIGGGLCISLAWVTWLFKSAEASFSLYFVQDFGMAASKHLIPGFVPPVKSYASYKWAKHLNLLLLGILNCWDILYL